MKTSRLRLKRIAELLQPERQFGTFEFASMAELKYFVELVEKNILAKALYVLLSLVNLEESAEAIAEFRSEWDSVGYRIEDESDRDLLRFRDQLRTLWIILEEDHLGKDPTIAFCSRPVKPAPNKIRTPVRPALRVAQFGSSPCHCFHRLRYDW